MVPTIATAALMTAVALVEGDGGKAPDWVQLLPAGPLIEARDGRNFRFTNPQTVLDHFARRKLDLAIDYEHAQDSDATKDGQPAPAAGWISALEMRSGAIWGRVEWTAKAAAMIATKEYRFLSPSFLYDEDEQEIVGLLGAGLVNRPAFHMQALARAAAAQTQSSQETSMSNRIAKALDLIDGASEDQMIGAIDKLRKDVASAVAVDTAKYVPRADYDELKAAADKATARVTELEGAARDTQIAALLDEHAEKVPPAARDHYTAMAREEGGLERLKGLLEVMPTLAKSEQLKGKDVPKSGDGPSATELATAATQHVKDMADKGVTVSYADAVVHVSQEQSK